jgi:hypothetical protein
VTSERSHRPPYKEPRQMSELGGSWPHKPQTYKAVRRGRKWVTTVPAARQGFWEVAAPMGYLHTSHMVPSTVSALQVKQIMEEAVTRKFVHEDSSHIISFCGESVTCPWLESGSLSGTPGGRTVSLPGCVAPGSFWDPEGTLLASTRGKRPPLECGFSSRGLGSR